MVSLHQSSKLANVLYEIRGAADRRARELEHHGADILKLNIGNPQPFGFKPPEELVYRVSESLKYFNGYTESKGIVQAREAVVRRYQGLYNLDSFHPDRVYLGNGVSELIAVSLQALVNDGDEILIPSPDYPLWTAVVSLCGGRPVHYRCREDHDWLPDIADIREQITPRTKAIVVINPNNPTGAVYPEDYLANIVDIAEQYGLLLLSDEIYDNIIYDDYKHVPLAKVAREVPCITFAGLSKSLCLAGYRSGWMALSGDFSDSNDYLNGLDLLSSTRLCPNILGQLAVYEGLSDRFQCRDEGSDLSISARNGRLKAQRNLTTRMLNDIPGVTVNEPRGALYAFPRIDVLSNCSKTDEQFVLDFLESSHVLLVHGSGFSFGANDHVRLVMLPDQTQLSAALTRLGDFISDFE